MLVSILSQQARAGAELVQHSQAALVVDVSAAECAAVSWSASSANRLSPAPSSCRALLALLCCQARWYGLVCIISRQARAGAELVQHLLAASSPLNAATCAGVRLAASSADGAELVHASPA